MTLIGVGIAIILTMGTTIMVVIIHTTMTDIILIMEEGTIQEIITTIGIIPMDVIMTMDTEVVIGEQL